MTINKECKYCEGDNQVIKEYNYWRLAIHINQYYLGRCKIILKRHIEDITEIKDNERDELFVIMKNLRKAIIDLFGANLFNYASLGNITRHVHVHIIPRYDHIVKFRGHIFKDENWGRNYAPYPKDFIVSEELLDSIKQRIISQL